MKMNKRVKKKWVEALLSGEYKQGGEQLVIEPDYKNEDYSFCCLGVLQNLYDLEQGQDFSTDFDGAVHSLDCAAWSGLTNQSLNPSLTGQYHAQEFKVSRLMQLNDSGRSFKYIAAYIKRYL